MKNEPKTDGEVPSPAATCSVLPYPERCKQARKTETGDNWRHLKTGKTVIVLGRVGPNTVRLLHQSGRKTFKQDHYLAGDYELLSPHDQGEARR